MNLKFKYEKTMVALLVGLFLTACAETDIMNHSEGVPLRISVTSEKHVSRVSTEETQLPDNVSLGVTVVASDGSKYEGKDYSNMEYISSDGRNFTASDGPMLTQTVAKAVAYYPYSEYVTDMTAIPVNTESQTDYMYSGWHNGLSENSPEANFTMKHAMSVIRIVLAKEPQYVAQAVASSIQIVSDAFYESATLDATTGSLNNLTGAGAVLERTVNHTLNSVGEAFDFLVLPGTSAADINFMVKIGDESFNAVSSSVGLQSGHIYTFALTLTAEGFKVYNLSIKPWGEKSELTATLEEKPFTWDNAPNGVYAVKKEGNTLVPVTYADADESCIAVALIVNDAPTPQRLMIEKNETKNTTSIKAAYTEDGASNTSYKYFYWGMYGLDNTSITNYTQTGGGGTSSYGYLPKADGTYQSTPNLSGDYTTWTSGALSDFNGKENTAALLAASDTDSYTTYANMATWCKTFNQTATENQGYTDWYIPACGQLALMWLNMAEINTALTAIGGTTISSYYYWSSSEYSSYNGWYVGFGTGCVDYDFSKCSGSRVRFVRDLPTTITFTIGDNVYVAEEGMTWGEWLTSDYNTDGCSDYGSSGIRDKDLGSITLTGAYDYVKPEDLIITDYNYVVLPHRHDPI